MEYKTKGRRFSPAFLHVKRKFILMYKIQNPPMAQGFRGIFSLLQWEKVARVA